LEDAFFFGDKRGTPAPPNGPTVKADGWKTWPMGRLRDPARALRAAVRQDDEAKVGALINWLLKRVPLVWNDEETRGLVSVSIIRGAVDASTDGFAFEVDEDHVVCHVRRREELPNLGVGDQIVAVNGRPLDGPLREAVAPESVGTLGVWKRGAMAATRARLARATLDDALLEAAQHASEPAACRIADRLLAVRASVHQHDEHGLSALHWAAYRGKLELVSMLVAAGASLDGPTPPPPAVAPPPARGVGGTLPRGHAHTPLQLAVIAGQASVARALLAARADPFVPCAGGRQLLHLAALGPCSSLVEL
jgi:hypothetical protein